MNFSFRSFLFVSTLIWCSVQRLFSLQSAGGHKKRDDSLLCGGSDILKWNEGMTNYKNSQVILGANRYFS